jgi:hypothetical protein
MVREASLFFPKSLFSFAISSFSNYVIMEWHPPIMDAPREGKEWWVITLMRTTLLLKTCCSHTSFILISLHWCAGKRSDIFGTERGVNFLASHPSSTGDFFWRARNSLSI